MSPQTKGATVSKGTDTVPKARPYGGELPPDPCEVEWSMAALSVFKSLPTSVIRAPAAQYSARTDHANA